MCVYRLAPALSHAGKTSVTNRESGTQTPRYCQQGCAQRNERGLLDLYVSHRFNRISQQIFLRGERKKSRSFPLEIYPKEEQEKKSFSVGLRFPRLNLPYDINPKSCTWSGGQLPQMKALQTASGWVKQEQIPSRISYFVFSESFCYIPRPIGCWRFWVSKTISMKNGPRAIGEKMRKRERERG